MSKTQPNKKSESKNKHPNAGLKYAGIAMQLAITIGIGAYIGSLLDKRFELETPYLTALFALLATGGVLYAVFRDLMKTD